MKMVVISVTTDDVFWTACNTYRHSHCNRLPARYISL